ncbi:AbrB/MazE/SpoVT family DNA-binding domain-containing protein [Fictibacillus sp. KIGAM418]|uniref:AbrB/MazE/SpoVT family DNA-binding domain-containing protein n=1 Tax=Fictibacillus marinisediminis TaxID=2878389 RepID=A0A9X2BFB3_9BACL|nr:AbrB/MazE/SpoVT family DNA-binding domain-containing protein [Fictibacillus marinisediminis]MCK6259556.1 AbrB/MazE/SpoVT family DNA-binding domain-containing protein [Fictibacillus marinisediminis]
MKGTGIVRKVDELGRIVIPIELRRVLDIEIKDAMEIYTEGDLIILKKHSPENACVITGEINPQNKEYGIGGRSFVLSPKGAEILLQEIQNQTDNVPVSK